MNSILIIVSRIQADIHTALTERAHNLSVLEIPHCHLNGIFEDSNTENSPAIMGFLLDDHKITHEINHELLLQH